MVNPIRSLINCRQIRRFHLIPLRLKGRFKYYRIDKPVPDAKYQGPDDYFETEGLKLDFSPEYIDKLGEIWEKKMAYHKELYVKRDDHLIKQNSNYWLPKIDQSQIRPDYADVEALKTAPEPVRRMFSIEFGTRKALTEVWKQMFMEKYQFHQLDSGISLPTLIAAKTANIRQWTMLIDSMVEKPAWLRKMIRLSVERRRKLLRILREQDEPMFEKIIKDLKIAYHVPPLPEDLPMLTRKGWVEFIAKKKSEMHKDNLLKEYHEKLKVKREKDAKKREELKTKLTHEKEQLTRDIQALRTEDDVVLDVVGRYPLDTISEGSENYMNSYFFLQSDMKKRASRKIFDD